METLDAECQQIINQKLEQFYDEPRPSKPSEAAYFQGIIYGFVLMARLYSCISKEDAKDIMDDVDLEVADRIFEYQALKELGQLN